MRRLLEMEVALRPVPLWAQAVARQVQSMAPCGWCFPQFVEVVCMNIGARDAAAADPKRCYDVGPHRLALMANFAVCLDGWLKGVSSEVVAVELRQHSTVDGRDWIRFARSIHRALGEPIVRRRLLVRRLLARLRFWLRAPLGKDTPDDNWRLGYFYTHAMGRDAGWDYFSLHTHDAEIAELDERIAAELDEPERWLTLIDSTWPCAPKVFRYLERLILAIGQTTETEGGAPPRITDPLPDGFLEIADTYLATDRSRALYAAAVSALATYLANAFPAGAPVAWDVDADLAASLSRLLGEPTPVKCWPAALLLKRITLFADSFKRFHFTRDPNQIH